MTRIYYRVPNPQPLSWDHKLQVPNHQTDAPLSCLSSINLDYGLISLINKPMKQKNQNFINNNIFRSNNLIQSTSIQILLTSAVNNFFMTFSLILLNKYSYRFSLQTQSINDYDVKPHRLFIYLSKKFPYKFSQIFSITKLNT